MLQVHQLLMTKADCELNECREQMQIVLHFDANAIRPSHDSCWAVCSQHAGNLKQKISSQPVHALIIRSSDNHLQTEPEAANVAQGVYSSLACSWCPGQ